MIEITAKLKKTVHPVAPEYVDGEITITLNGDNIATEFQDIVDRYIVDHYTTTLFNHQY